MIESLARRVWESVYRLYGVRANVTLGRRVHVGVGSILWAPHGLTVEDDVYIGKYCTVECDGTIGRAVMIANNVGLIGRHDHDFRHIGTAIRHSPWVGDAGYSGPGRNLKLIIGDDVWIGFGAIVLSGVTIGRGAIIGAGSVVAADIGPYAVVVGNPARQVAMRFDPAEIVAHERLLERQ